MSLGSSTGGMPGSAPAASGGGGVAVARGTGAAGGGGAVSPGGEVVTTGGRPVAPAQLSTGSRITRRPMASGGASRKGRVMSHAHHNRVAQRRDPRAALPRHNRRMIPATAVLILAATAATATPTPTLESRLAALAAEAGGVAGVAILHVESGQRASLRGGERFCMASVYKLPIAIALLRSVDRGRIALDQKVTYGARDLRPGIAHSAIVDRAAGGSAAATVRELVEAMLIESDNTASDLVMGLLGGPAAVTAELRAAGLGGIDVSRPEGQIPLDYWGVTGAPPSSEW